MACGQCSLFSGWLQTDYSVTSCHVTTSQNSWQAPSLRVTVTKERDSHQDIVNWILCLHFLSHDAEVRPPISVSLYFGLVTKGKLWWKCDNGLTSKRILQAVIHSLWWHPTLNTSINTLESPANKYRAFEIHSALFSSQSSHYSCHVISARPR